MCLFGLIQRQPFTARCCATESYSKVRFFCFFFYFSWKCWKFSYEYTGNNIRTFYLVTFVSCTWCWCLVVVYVSVWYLFIMLESRLPDCSQAASTDERRYLYVFCVFFYPTFMIIFPFDKKKNNIPHRTLFSCEREHSWQQDCKAFNEIPFAASRYLRTQMQIGTWLALL